MSLERLAPTAFGFGFSGLAAMIDINFGVIAGGITLVGGAVAAVWWQLSQNRTKAFAEAEAAKVKAFRDMEEAKLELQIKFNEANKGSMAEQMERLNQNLELAEEKGNANLKLAETASKQADRLQEMYEQAEKRYAESEKRNAELLASMAKIESRTEDVNKKLHAIRNESMGDKGTIMVLQAELDEYKARLGPVIEKADSNQAAIQQATVKVEALAAKVEGAGHALTDVGQDLIDPKP